MGNLENYLKMLQSEKVSVRYDACEELRVATESTPEIILALEKAQNDADAGVAERARAALDADVHQQMALKMGKTELLKQQGSKVQTYHNTLEGQQSKSQAPITFEPIIGAVFGAITTALFSIGFGDSTGFIVVIGTVGGVCGGIGAIVAKSVVRKWYPILTNPWIISIIGGVAGGITPYLLMFFCGLLFYGVLGWGA